MLKRMIAMALAAGMFIPLSANGQEKAKPVREIVVKGLRINKRGSVEKPVVVKNAKDLAKGVPSTTAQQKIKKQVDFEKENVLVFAWAGSGQDRLVPTVKGGGVVLEYSAGLTRDLRRHVKIFVVGKKTEWKIVRKRR